MQPPPPGNLKRKTLAERAGETVRPAPAPPSIRQINGAVKATSMAGTLRQSSLSSSVSSRPPSTSSMRNVSSSSFSSSMSSASRPPSAQAYRPQTTLSSHYPQKALFNSRRPASSFEIHQAPVITMQTDGNRQCMTPFSSNVKGNHTIFINSKMSEESYDNQMNCISDWSSSVAGLVSQSHPVKSAREVSISTALQGLTLSPRESISVPAEDVDHPCTPSFIPKRTLNPALPLERSSPTRSPKKSRPIIPFLTRDSNTKSIAWNTEDRLDTVEHLYSELKEKMDGTTTESNGLKETITIYKTRSG